jgi:hypothetical protein
MPAEEVGAVRASAEARLLVREVQLELSDLGAAFPRMVLRPSGALSGRCPIDRRHELIAVIDDDDGAPLLSCAVCERRSATRERFAAAVVQRLPHLTTSPAVGPLPTSGWMRQPEGAPAVAVRDLCNRTREALHDPDRQAEVDAWMATQ